MNSPRFFEYVFRVPFHQVDGAGVVFFAHLFTHAHDAYERFMASLDLSLDRLLRESHYDLPIVHAAADYRLPLRHGMEIRVHLWVARLGDTSFTTAYDFIGPGGEHYAHLELVHCCTQRDTGQKRTLPPELSTQLLHYTRNP
jgi:YbgC/YbaW family acyl-CoA thioester hydrolase